MPNAASPSAEKLTLGRFLRDNPLAQTLLCIPLGILVSLVTIALHDSVLWLHELVFSLPTGMHLSEAPALDPRRVVLMPVAGGLLAGFFLWLQKFRNAKDIVDPIEANAVHGGRMSISSSLRLVIATLISNGAGASIGMEAAYTQLGSSLTSRFGRALQLRRSDLRIFVSAGAAAAIAAAFNAPMAGAFYGFELVLGSYTIAALPQVALSALSSAIFLRMVTDGQPVFSLAPAAASISFALYPLFLGAGALAALVGIVTMKLVTGVEAAFRKGFVPEALRPAIGGLLLGFVALKFPQILGSGQGAIDNHLHNEWPLLLLAGLLAAKMFGSAISIGSGFKGGLFSSSLLIGCLFGQALGLVAARYIPAAQGQVETFMLVGIGSVAASIVGAPVTMVLLVLEMTQDLASTAAVLVAVIVSSALTRTLFGYSFSTWRFHLRGLRIFSAHDIGWVNELTMGSLMHVEPKMVPAQATLEEVRGKIPLGGEPFALVVDDAGNYDGVLNISEAYARQPAHELRAKELAKGAEHFLLRGQNIREALAVFSGAKMELLPVLGSAQDKRILGSVTENYLLKRYAQELELRDQE